MLWWLISWIQNQIHFSSTKKGMQAQYSRSVFWHECDMFVMCLCMTSSHPDYYYCAAWHEHNLLWGRGERVRESTKQISRSHRYRRTRQAHELAQYSLDIIYTANVHPSRQVSNIIYSSISLKMMSKRSHSSLVNWCRSLNFYSLSQFH